MRRSIWTLAAGLAVSLALAVAGAAPAAAAEPKLLGHWPLDGSYEDGASDVSPDASGNGLGLKAPVGSVHLGGPALFGTGATLGTNLTPLQVTSPVLAPEQVTLLAWIKQSGNPGTLRYIAGRGDDGAPTCLGSTFALYSGYPPNGGDPAGKPGLRFYVRSGAAGGGSLTAAPADSAVFNNQWHLVAGTYDGSAARLYLDGVQVGAAVPGFGALKYALGGGSSFYVDGYPVDACVIGVNGDDWPGPIDDVRVYDRALSATELQRLAAAPPGPSGPVLVTDESLLPPPVIPPAAPAAAAPTGLGASKPVAAQQLAAAAARLEGASKAAVKPALKEALAKAQEQALAAMKSAASASSVLAAETQRGLSKKQAQAVQPDKRMQARLEAMKYGIAAEVQAKAPGAVVEVAATVALERKQNGKVRTQQIVLPPVVGVAGATGTVTIQIPVDGKATAAMTRGDVAKAAIGVQAAEFDSLDSLGPEIGLRLQSALGAYNQAVVLLQNVLEKVSDTRGEITKNLDGGVTKSEQDEQKRLRAAEAKLERDAKLLEQQRDAASQQATQAINAAVAGLLDGLPPAGPAFTGGVGTLLPLAWTSLSGCKYCKLSALVASQQAAKP